MAGDDQLGVACDQPGAQFGHYLAVHLAPGLSALKLSVAVMCKFRSLEEARSLRWLRYLLRLYNRQAADAPIMLYVARE